MKIEDNNALPRWHTGTPVEIAAALQVDLQGGLSAAEAHQRLSQFGPNRLAEEEKEPLWKEFIEELREPLILLLIFTGVLYTLLGEVSDGITIFVVILTLNTIEVVNEQRAKKAISALQRLTEPAALVVRDGGLVELPAEQLAPGDLLVLRAGRRVPADARLVEASGLAVDESTLTGESMPVDKNLEALSEGDPPLSERGNMVYSGTLVTRGHGKALVTATGMDTELGQVVGLVRAVREPRTPLQEAMEEVSKTLVWAALAFSLGIPSLGWLVGGQPLETMILTGLSLAFATIPEEMPIIITMVLSLGAFRLSKQHAVVKRLKSVEVLGAVTVIATDKTGTLTENRMVVREIYPESKRKAILTAGVLCSESLLDERLDFGDPLEMALVQSAQADGLQRVELEAAFPRREEYAFDNGRKRMSVVRREGQDWHVWVKGAPESVLACCLDKGAEDLLVQADRMADSGLRVIAFAEKTSPQMPANQDQVESGLRFVGLVGLLDPARDEVRPAIEQMAEAGIRTVMITGDHPLTARAVAAQAGLDDIGRLLTGPELDALEDVELQEAVKVVSIFARTTPAHKLRIVSAFQANGERVAVTGDGVNDAPALAAADIGVAMGCSGSDVAREAGDMVLTDDNYTTIAAAVREGRALFANLKKGVRYYLTIKVALVAVMALPVLLQIPAPFAPIQIILMELFMDLAAAAAFVAEPAEGDLMRRPPRQPSAPFMDRAMVSGIFGSASGLFLAVAGVYLWNWFGGAGLAQSQTAALAAWMLGHVLLAFNMRSERQPLYQVGLFSNRLMLAWGAAAVAFVVGSTLLPFMQNALKTAVLSAAQWSLVVLAAVAGTFWMEIYKAVTYRSDSRSGR